MRNLLLLSVCLVVCATFCTESVYGSDAKTDARIRVALALTNAGKVQTQTHCYCGGDPSVCTCTDCQCLNGQSCLAAKSSGPLEYAIYLAAYDSALRQNKPLLIWVGETCPACENRWTEYVHARLSQFGGWGTTPIEQGPEVIVAKPDGLGGMDLTGRFQGIPTKASVEGLLNPVRQGILSRPLSAPAMMLMMQEFGGGGMAMGSGGGG